MKKIKPVSSKKLKKYKGLKIIFFGIPFVWTEWCWVNEYIPKANGLQKENK